MVDHGSQNSTPEASSVAEEQFVYVAETMQPSRAATGKPHVVIIGGGFAGLNAAKSLADAPVRITLIDRRNHHLFAPLLYQVATAQISPANIAQPIRGILNKQKNVEVIMGEATTIDAETKRVSLADGQNLKYDYLIVAVGATHSYFGNDQWAPMAPGLKSLEDAVGIRRQLLLAFEQAEREADPAKKRALLTFIVVGGGPTGVELAGAMGELTHHTLARDFRNIDPRQARIILLEGLPRILPMFSEKLSERATSDLGKFGVEVRNGSFVTHIDEGGVNLGDERIDAMNVFWTAGVAASDLTQTLSEQAELDRAGRVPVERELSLSGYPEIFVVGDAASAKEADGSPLPGVAPVAIQGGRWAAENIKRALAGQAYTAFSYQDRGTMATIGRNQAIAEIGGRQMTGFPAWIAWLVVHLYQLIGFRNRMLVMMQWFFNYVRFGRGARLITNEQPKEE